MLIFHSIDHSGKHYYHRLDNGLIEIPPNSLMVLGKKVPTCGGFFFRLCPVTIYKMYVKFLNSQKIPLVFYTHSWELHPSKNRLKLPVRKYFIQYYNLNSVHKKFFKLVDVFDFMSIYDYLQKHKVEVN